MAFEKIVSLDSEVAIKLGGVDKKTGKPNPTSIEGYFLGTRGGLPNKFDPNKPNCMHIFQTAKGNVGVWGKSHLDSQLSRVIPGTMVRASFTGTRPSNKGNDAYLFLVEQDKSNCIDVGGLDVSPAPQEDDSYTDTEAYGADDVAEEPVYVAPTPPKAAPKAPDAARQAKVQALLQGTRNKTA